MLTGCDRLLEPKAQEEFYDKIVERYMTFCAYSGGGENLDREFAAMAISTYPQPATFTTKAKPRPADTADSAKVEQKGTEGPLAPRSTNAPGATPSPELSNILGAMRKLREAIVASRRTDLFAQRAYIFIIHGAILARQLEAYHPALSHLLHAIHPHTPLSASELHEFASYQILDLACRQNNLAAAYAVRVRYDCRDRRVDALLRALAHDDWTAFWRIRRAVDGYQKRLIEWADNGMRLHALKCLGRSYMSADRSYIEKCTQASWDRLVAGGVGWELGNEERVLIRKPKVK